ncbi:MAG: hypothetical protein U1F09_12170 [Steroidobacteraceae bacterium]
MNVFLFLGLVLGAAVTPPLCRKIASSTSTVAVVVPLAMCIYGLLPAILIRAGLVEKSVLRTVLALTFFIAFSVISTVALNGARARAEQDNHFQ